MDEVVESVIDYLVSRYGFFSEEARSLVYAEWDFVEATACEEPCSEQLCKEITETLLDMYMVA